MAAQSHVTHLALGHAAMATPGAIHGVPMTFDTIKQIEMTQDANWVKCGNVWESLGERDNAIECYVMSTRHNPTNAPLLVRLGQLYREKDQFQEAADVLERALQIDGANLNAWIGLGHAYMMMDNLQKSHKAFQRALQLSPRSSEPQLWFGISQLYERMGNFDGAADALLSLLSVVSPTNLDRVNEIHYRIALVFKQQRKFDHALANFRLVLEAPPRPLSKSDVQYQIGLVLEAQGNLNEAKEIYEQILQLDPKHAKTMGQLGWLAFNACVGDPSKVGQMELALTCLHKSIELDPSDAQSWYRLGRAYTTLRHHVNAFEALQQAVFRDFGNPLFWCAIGVLYFQINQPRDALGAYLRAIRLNPNLSEVWFDLGTLYESCNQLTDALDAYQHAAVNDPNNRQVRERIQRISEIFAQKGLAPPPMPQTPGARVQQAQQRAQQAAANFPQGQMMAGIPQMMSGVPQQMAFIQNIPQQQAQGLLLNTSNFPHNSASMAMNPHLAQQQMMQMQQKQQVTMNPTRRPLKTKRQEEEDLEFESLAELSARARATSRPAAMTKFYEARKAERLKDPSFAHLPMPDGSDALDFMNPKTSATATQAQIAKPATVATALEGGAEENAGLLAIVQEAGDEDEGDDKMEVADERPEKADALVEEAVAAQESVVNAEMATKADDIDGGEEEEEEEEDDEKDADFNASEDDPKEALDYSVERRPAKRLRSANKSKDE